MPRHPDRCLGKAFRQLRPVQHALLDPYFALVARPIDSGWYNQGITGAMGGFNPLHHSHYFPVESAIARWLDDSAAIVSSEEEERLGNEVLQMAHDYLHSWAYRAITHIKPSLVAYNTVTHQDLDKQAFVVVLTEAAAVVGMDYWYLSVRGAGKRCGMAMEIGPRTVHYQERYIGQYRLAKPSLVVQQSEFFLEIVRLYSDGVIVGFDEMDLLDNRPLANWLIRELLIAPQQREISRLWLSRLGGFEVDETELRCPFSKELAEYLDVARRLGELLWRKIKYGAHLFFPPLPEQSRWCYPPAATVDFRFANFNRLEKRKVNWSGPHGSESWRFFVDQVVSGHRLPASESVREAIRHEIGAIKAEIATPRLLHLTRQLTPIDYPDRAPLELLFVN